MNNPFTSFEKDEQDIFENNIIKYSYRLEMANVFSYTELLRRGTLSQDCYKYLTEFAIKKGFNNWDDYFVDFNIRNPLIHNSYTQNEVSFLQKAVSFLQKAVVHNKRISDLNIIISRDKKTFIIITASILLAAFFMPWIHFVVSLNAWDLVFKDLNLKFDNPIKYLLLLIPISSFVIIYGVVFDEGKYPINKSNLFSISWVALVITTILIFAKVSDLMGNFDFGIDKFLDLFSIGFWLTLVGSVFLNYLGRISHSNNIAATSVTNEPLLTSAILPLEYETNVVINQSTTIQTNMVEQLEKLLKMKKEGHITDDEYSKMKTRIIVSID